MNSVSQGATSHTRPLGLHRHCCPPRTTPFPPCSQRPPPHPPPKARGSSKGEGNPEVKAQLRGSLPSSAQHQWDGAASPTTTWAKTWSPKKVKPRGTALVPGAQLPRPSSPEGGLISGLTDTGNAHPLQGSRLYQGCQRKDRKLHKSELQISKE